MTFGKFATTDKNSPGGSGGAEDSRWVLDRSGRRVQIKDLQSDERSRSSAWHEQGSGHTVYTDAPVLTRASAFGSDGGESKTCSVNGMFFDRGAPLATMRVGQLQEWEVTSVSKHPLHLHVNPFQITEIGDGDDPPHWTKPRALGGGRECDLEYGYSCVGDWYDTLQFPTAAANDAFTSKIRFVTADFVGDQVLHCHYLQHEDLGCMTYLRIVQ